MVERFREEAHVGGRSGHSRAVPSEIAAYAVQLDIEEGSRAQ
jgi:cytochrome c oxidase subunit 1